MAPTTKRKRPELDAAPVSKPNYTLLPTPTKPLFTPGHQCPICLTLLPKPSALLRNPTTCTTSHNTLAHRACGQCWEAYLSLAIEEQPLEEITCMFCPSRLPETELKTLCRDKTVERLEGLRDRRGRQTCMARCPGSVVHGPGGEKVTTGAAGSVHFEFEQQAHDLETDGRVFACKYCGFASCVVCDRPEHVGGKTCSTYQTRMGLHDPLPPAQPLDPKKKATMNTAIKNCPSCDIYWSLEEEGGCGFVQCYACQHRFCQRCLIPWVGTGSEYLVGPRGHGWESVRGRRCKYATRLYPNEHGLMDRFMLEPGVEQNPSVRAGRMKG
ncbi:hypothetical protein LTR86_001422 [Recurvomyces mirabilis]|nr:hypothetical protein LTR86_001422 [Recurvomyces mirabilis]